MQLIIEPKAKELVYRFVINGVEKDFKELDSAKRIAFLHSLPHLFQHLKGQHSQLLDK